MSGGEQLFSARFDQDFRVGAEGNRAYFGQDVIRGLVEGIDDFIQLRQPRWDRYRRIGPVLLGSTMWINDPELIGALERLTGACVVIRKQDRSTKKLEELERLRAVNERTRGLPIRAFPALGGFAPKVDGEPAIVGGSLEPFDDAELPTFRTLGYRRTGALVPILHAKLALLGQLWWHDEGAAGHLEDVVGFTRKRLWVSSANFTTSSRRSLEFGYWTEDPALLEGAERFLVNLMEFSEDLNPDADDLDPTLAPVEFDEDAIAEHLADSDWAEEGFKDDEDG